jgi:two-component system nitrogen regulation sensor histidine kinase NtrY
MPGAALAPALVAAGLDAAESVLERAAASGEPITARVTIDDSDREWTLVRVPLPGSGEPTDLIVIEDITDVLRAQRLEAWAAMARIIAHEIKNPLTPIRLSAEHLREAWSRDREHFAAVFERCTSNILAQVEELRRTASEFSLYSAIPVIEPQRADLRDAVAEIVEAYRGGPSAPVQVTLAAPDAEVAVSFDRRLLGRALRNLVENAVRASPAGSTVEVTIERLDGEATIRVADQGAGVPPELLGRILEPYFSTQSGGTGLGLPIARRVAEEHGGGLSVRNRPSGGFEVAITIPLS